MQQLSLFQDTKKGIPIIDLFKAYYEARKNKRNTINALAFKLNYESELFLLHEEINEQNYEIKPSICFINFKPVQREIFAGNFRDRIVHHLIFYYINPTFERYFINDSYSCRIGKGTSYGIKRINKFIRSCSSNYKTDCYILKLDIKGYFMAMDKNILYQKIRTRLEKCRKDLTFDLDLIYYLIEKVIFNEPTENCIIKGKKTDWKGLPKSKSLFHSEKNKGLPIGNLTSQLFGNVYMDEFDHFVKHYLKVKYYGRYVDDFILIHENKDYLKFIIPIIQDYLKNNLKLELHPNKISLQHYSKGVKFLGTIIKPYRIYISSRTKNNFYQSIQH